LRFAARNRPLGRERGDAFHERADELGPGVEVQGDRVFESGGEQLVLDHQCRHPHQGHGVLVEAAPVAADVEHADDRAMVVDDGRGGAGEEVVRGQVVLVGVHGSGRLFGERSADRVRSLALLGPVDARRQCDAVGFFEKVGIAQRMQDYAARVGEQDRVVRVGDLLVKRLHCRHRVAVQHAVLFDQRRESGDGKGIEVGTQVDAQAVILGTAMRAGNRCRQLVSHSMSPGWPWSAALSVEVDY
jgi:hypothetical protein